MRYNDAIGWPPSIETVPHLRVFAHLCIGGQNGGGGFLEARRKDSKLNSNTITKITAAKTALLKASTFEDVLEIRDKATALQVYIKAAGEGLETQNQAAEIRLRAERRVGEMLAAMELHGGDRKSKSQDVTLKLDSIGITKMQSSRWQTEAKLDEDEFDEIVRECIEEKKELTQSLILGKAKAKKEAKDKPKSKKASGVKGDGTWQFIAGDCRKLDFPDDHFDLVFCSPPYEAQREYGDLKFSLSGQDWVEWAVECYIECLRVCKGLVAWVVEGFTDDFAYSSTPFLLMADLHRKGFKMRKPVVYKRNGIPGTGGPDWLRNDWEPIICGTKHGRLPWADNKAMGSKPKQNKPRVATNRHKDGSRKHTTYIDPDISNPGNIIEGLVGSGGMGWKDATQNEAPFPEWLAEFFIQSFCPPGGTVLDPFSGSGTTVSMAVKHGRNGVGVDARESQIWLAETRLMGLTVKEREAGQKLLV